MTNAGLDPRNPTATARVDENWSIGDSLRLDNDGDNLYDSADRTAPSLRRMPASSMRRSRLLFYPAAIST